MTAQAPIKTKSGTNSTQLDEVIQELKLFGMHDDFSMKVGNDILRPEFLSSDNPDDFLSNYNIFTKLYKKQNKSDFEITYLNTIQNQFNFDRQDLDKKAKGIIDLESEQKDTNSKYKESDDQKELIRENKEAREALTPKASTIKNNSPVNFKVIAGLKSQGMRDDFSLKIGNETLYPKLLKSNNSNEFLANYNIFNRLYKKPNKSDFEVTYLNTIQNQFNFDRQDLDEKAKGILDLELEQEDKKADTDTDTDKDDEKYKESEEQKALKRQDKQARKLSKEQEKSIKVRRKELEDVIKKRREENYHHIRNQGLFKSMTKVAEREELKDEDLKRLEHLHDMGAVNGRFSKRLLTRDEKAILADQKQTSVLGDYFKDRSKQVLMDKVAKPISDKFDQTVVKPTSSKIDNALNSRIKNLRGNKDPNAGVQRRVLVALQKQRKKQNKNLLKAAGDLVGHQVTRPFRYVKGAVKMSRPVMAASRIKVGAVGKWNSFKASKTVQNVVKTKNLGGKVIGGVKHGVSGMKTGALLAAPMVLVNPALAPAAFVAGTGVGSMKSFVNTSYKMDISKFSPNDFKMFSSLNDFKLKIALSNPINAVKFDQLSDVAKDSIRKIDPNIGDKIPSDFYKKFGKFSNMKNLLKAVDWFGAGMLAGSLMGLSGAGALAAGAGAYAVGYTVNHSVDKIAAMMVKNTKLINLLKFPGMSLLDIGTGSYTLVEQVDILRNEGLEGWREDQMKALIPGIAGTKGIANALSTAGFVSGTTTLTGWAMKFAAVPLPTVAKLAPLILPAIYITAMTLLGLPISAGVVIGLTISGAAAVGIAALAGSTSAGLGAFPTWAIANTVLAPFGYFLGTKVIDPLIEKFSNAVGGIQGLMALAGVYNLFKAFLILMEGSINKLSDYAQAATVAVTLVTSFAIFLELQEDLAKSAEQIQPKDEIGAFYNIDKGQEYQSIASSYSIPPIRYDCTNFVNENIVSDTDFEIKEILDLESNGQLSKNIKGEKNGQQIIIKNLEGIDQEVLNSMKVEKGSVIGNCL